MRRATIKRQLRDLHGPEAEILEFDGDEPSGRAYRLSKPDPWAGHPMWFRLIIGIGGMAILTPVLIVLLIALAGSLGLLFLILKSFF